MSNTPRRSLNKSLTSNRDVRGDPEDDLFDECFQEEELAPTSQSPEPELGETLEPEGPPELKDSSDGDGPEDGETLRIKSESARTKRSRPKPVQKETSCDLGDHNLTHFPKDPRCEICNDCKIQRVHCRKQKHGPPDEPLLKSLATSSPLTTPFWHRRRPHEKDTDTLWYS